MRNISPLFGGRGRGVVGLLALVMVAGSVGSAPLPACAACDQDTLTFGVGQDYKFSTQGYVSYGTCDDVNMYYYVDGDGCNGESITHRGYWWDPGCRCWVAGREGFVLSNECQYKADNPLLLNMDDTGIPYKFYSMQSGGSAIGLD